MKAKRDKAPADKRTPKHSNDAARANKTSKSGRGTSLRDAATVSTYERFWGLGSGWQPALSSMARHAE